MTRIRQLAPLLVLLGVAALAAVPVLAQSEGYSYLSYVGPEVSLVSHDEEDSSARVNMPILAGDRISTARGSRAEAILADGTVVRFDSRTEARFESLARTYESEDDRTLIALSNGALAVETRRGTDEDRAIRIDTDDATVVVPVRALVRVDVGKRGTEVYVASGRAEVMGRAGRTALQAGETAYVSGSDPVDVAESEMPRDGFTQFIAERRQVSKGDSARYLEEARTADAAEDDALSADSYAAQYDASLLDGSGGWAYIAGRWCWRPHVAVGWAPYSNGFWRWTPCGLTWVSYESWGWLPYHYGSWLWDDTFGWCWSPGWDYSPAWVYWSYSPGWVGWCPIGNYGGYGGWHGGGGHGGWGGGHDWHGGRFEWSRYPHLRGRVDLTKVDPRGWNYAPAKRIGARLERADVVRGDRTHFRPGETAVIATAPLRVDRTRGTPVRIAVQDAIRRVPAQAGRETDRGLTQILHRDRTLDASAVETLRRSTTTAGHDAGYRPARPETIAAGRFETSARGERAPIARAPEASAHADGWRSGGRIESRVERGDQRVESARPAARADDGWRSAGRGESSRFRRDEPSAHREDASPRADSWRSTPRERAVEPGSDPGSRTPSRIDSPRRDGSAGEHSGWRAPAPRSEPAPRRENRTYEPRPSERRIEPRREPAPRQEAPAPRREAPAPRSYEAPRPAPAPRSYEAPRPAPAPQPHYQPSAPHFESHSAPAPAPAAHGAQRRG